MFGNMLEHEIGGDKLFTFEVSIGAPVSAGLGSSASLSVALAAIMLNYKNPSTSPDLEAI